VNEETAKLLRSTFPPNVVGKLPRIICPKCRDARSKACDEHPKSKCRDCGNFITPRHIHLDYVGHAEVTDRLLQADPEWVWEPMALTDAGLPAVDGNGGLWIRLTVAGVTRVGYGHADGKTGADAVKEAIGDALRNAAMRFGVALDLWGAHGPAEADEQAPPAPQPSPADRARAQLTATCQQNKWDKAKVAALYDGDLKTETDAAAIEAFAKGLFGRPDNELKATA
jgi:hypothetical protein